MNLLALIKSVVTLQYFDHVFLAVNGDNSETEEFMFRKLAVLHRIIGFMFGPVVKQCVHSSVTLFYCFLQFIGNYCFAALVFRNLIK